MNIDLIKKWEGFKAKAYICPAGRLTIGYGSTYLFSKRRFVEVNDTITKYQAEEEVFSYLNSKVFPDIKDLAQKCGPIPIPLTESLSSLAYNVGPLCLESPILQSAIMQKDASAVADWFRAWVHIKKEVSDGLVKRREDEIHNFSGRIWV